MKHQLYRIIVGLFISSLPLSAMAGSLPEKGLYQIDPLHSRVGFEIPHLVISSVEGFFKTFSGSVEAGAKVQDLKIQGEVDIASIDTGVEKRDEHLKSPDFFDAAKYPKMTFKSSKVSGTPEDLKVSGDLTIHGVTKPVTFSGKYQGAVKDGYGNLKLAFHGKTQINRKDFGLTWGKMVEAGPAVGDEVTIDLKIQAAKAK